MLTHHTSRLLIVLLVLALLALGVPAATSRGVATIRGAVTRADAPAGAASRTSAAPRTAARAIVFAEPLDGAAPKHPGRFTLSQKGKAFSPRLLVVPVGSTVEFPNEDLIFHNVFSLSTPAPFDLGLYRAGASKSRLFAQPGLYRVFCNIHPQMTALIAVVATTHIATADANGAFTLDLPAGRYRVTAVSERGAVGTQPLQVTAGDDAPASVTLQVDDSQLPARHTNKFGQEYAADAWRGK